jgi:hypothetical protein
MFPLPHLRRTAAPLRGLTLVEMLVAMTLTLMLMGAVAQIFGMLGQGINGSRSLAELNDRMRSTAYRLRQDLAGLTVDITAVPPVKAALNTGYVEIIEGPETDLITYFSGTAFNKANGVYNASTGKWVGNAEPYLSARQSDDRLVGDVDDVLLFTTRSTGERFTGRVDTRNSKLEGGSIRSPFAEVVWFCRPSVNTSSPRLYTLYRRQRLVMAHPGAEPFVNTAMTGNATNTFGGPPNTLPFTDWASIYSLTDVSCRQQGSIVVPNCLGDLTRRENRFMHGSTFPYVFPLPMYATAAELQNITLDANPTRMGEDVILSNVLAFDVRVWDDNAPMQAIAAEVTTGTNRSLSQLAVEPGDPGYGPGVVAYSGAYVDLNWNGSPAPVDVGTPISTAAPGAFAGGGRKVRNSATNNTLPYPTYDSWSDYYEINGLDDDGDSVVDEGMDGQDNPVPHIPPPNGLIDEAAEQETSPPYPVPLKGIQVRIRCYEPSSRQIRQITVTTY